MAKIKINLSSFFLLYVTIMNYFHEIRCSSIEIVVSMEIKGYVPYANVKDFCNAKKLFIKDAKENKYKYKHNKLENDMEINGNTFIQETERKTENDKIDKFPFSTQRFYFEEMSILVDSGSEELWFSDDAHCTFCFFEERKCYDHQSKQKMKRIDYVKGFVEGTEMEANICNNPTTFLCATNTENLGIQGDGVLGLGAKGNGIQFLFNYLISEKGELQQKMKNQQEITKKEITFRYYESFGIMKIKFTTIAENEEEKEEISEESENDSPASSEIEEYIEMDSDTEWKFHISSLEILGIPIPISHKNTVSLDTGASKIVLPSNICTHFLEKLEEKYGPCAYVQSQGIDCRSIVKGDLKLKIKNEQISGNVINKRTNRIQIICSHSQSLNSFESEESYKSVILGYPFLVNKEFSFVEYSYSHKSNFEREKLNRKYKVVIKKEPLEQKNRKLFIWIVIFGHIFVVFVGTFALVTFLNHIREKRSSKIII